MALYAPVLGGRPFVDDWVYVLDRPGDHVLGAFGELHPYQFYRPLPLMIVALLQTLGGGSAVPLHLFQCAVHALLALLVARIAIRRGIPRGGSILAGLFVTVSQAAVAAVGGYDTLSLTLSTLLGTASLALLLGPPRPGMAAAAFAAALLCKESALGYLPLMVALSLSRDAASGAATPAGPRSGRRSALFSLLVMGITGAYLGWRAHLGGFAPAAGSGDYNMQLGGGVVLNLGMLWFAVLVPVSSVAVFTGAALRSAGVLLPGLLGTFLVLGLSLLGFARTRSAGRALVLIGAGSAALFPVLPLNHVSELYAYALLPFAGLLFGGSVWALAGGASRPAARAGLTALAAILLVSNAVSAATKARAMAENGRRAERLLESLSEEMRSLPPGGTLALIDPVPSRPNYSVFRIRSFRLVPDEPLIARSGRSDVRLIRIPAGRDSASWAGVDRAVTLDGHVRLLPGSGGKSW